MFEGKSQTLFLRFAVPQMVGLLFNSVYTIVDGVFIGQRLGREAMAAAAVAVPLIEILISVAIAAGSGAGGSPPAVQHRRRDAGRCRGAGGAAGQPVSGPSGPAAGGQP